MVLRECNIGALIPVSDLDRSVTFYQDTLGLPGAPAPSGYRLSAGGGSTLYLLTAPASAGVADWPLATVATDDLEQLVTDLVQRGVTMMTDVPYDIDERGISMQDGVQIAWIADPDGQVISLFQLIIDPAAGSTRS